MSTLILYATRYGCTEKCANQLSDKIKGQVEVKNLAKARDINLEPYNQVIIGGSIMAGKINKEVASYVNKNLNTLLGKKVGLFLCCLEHGKQAEKQMEEGFGAQLTERAIARGFFGGEIELRKLNFLLRQMIKKMLKTDQDVSRLSPENMDNFAVVLNKEIEAE